MAGRANPRHPPAGLIARLRCSYEVSPLIDEPVDTRGKAAVSSSPPAPSRARRLFAGWSANLFQMILGITQQVALVPVFLHFWTSDVLAAWLAIYSAGNLVLIADAGLQFRAINRFLGFKSSVDC